MSPGDEPAASRAFLRRFGLGTVTLLGLLLGLNLAVDPRAAFGTGWVPPGVVPHRDLRVRGLQDPFRPPPALVVLGSSRAWKVEPAFLEARTGLTAFVAGVDDARTEDHLALVRWLLAGPHPPRALLLQLDLPAVHETLPASPQLLRQAVLRPFLPEDIPWRDHLEPYLDALTHAALLDSLRALRVARLPTPPEIDVVVGPDGFVTYRLRERALAAGHFDLGHHVRETTDHFLGVYRGFQELSARRLAYLVELLDLAAARGVALRVFVPPLHPDQERALRASTAYPRLMPRFLRFLRRACAARGVPLFDGTRLESFGGDPALFYDGLHMREENNRRLLRHLYPEGSG